jgi:hypothetical protein
MPVSDIHKIIFVHIPKTGGTSFEYLFGMHGVLEFIGEKPYLDQKRNYELLFGGGLQHLTISEILYILGNRNFSQYQSLPESKQLIDKVLSKINFSVREKRIREILSKYYIFTLVRNPYDRLVSYAAWLENKWSEVRSLERDYFINKVNEIFERPESLKNKQLIPQFNFIYYKNKCVIHKIYKFEELDSTYTDLLQKFAISGNLPHRMKSYHDNFEYYYDDTLKKKVYNFYRKDFELFGYPE